MPVAARFETDRCDAALLSVGGVPQQVLVFQRLPGWFEVARRDEDWRNPQRIWIEESPVRQFHPVTVTAEQARLARQAWGPEHSTVRVVAFRQVGGDLWIKVELMSHSICEGFDEEPMVKARGWVPAPDSAGDPTIWFASRGC